MTLSPASRQRLDRVLRESTIAREAYERANVPGNTDEDKLIAVLDVLSKQGTTDAIWLLIYREIKRLVQGCNEGIVSNQEMIRTAQPAMAEILKRENEQYQRDRVLLTMILTKIDNILLERGIVPPKG